MCVTWLGVNPGEANVDVILSYHWPFTGEQWSLALAAESLQVRLKLSCKISQASDRQQGVHFIQYHVNSLISAAVLPRTTDAHG